MTIRVLLADDDPLLRAGLRLMLGTAPDIEVVGEAEDGNAAIAQAARLGPDVILMDIRMPGTNGVAATSAITAGPHAPHIIVLTTFDADDLVRQAISAGAAGYLVKDTPPAGIVSAVRSVAAGHGVLSPAVTRPLLDLVQQSGAQAPDRAGRDEAARERLNTLTERERDVAIAIARGASNAEIAAQLYVSAATVKAAVSRILTKLDLANRTQIAVVVGYRDAP
jgi:DNA-binding NarL/FixJ family response regulator